MMNSALLLGVSVRAPAAFGLFVVSASLARRCIRAKEHTHAPAAFKSFTAPASLARQWTVGNGFGSQSS